jgi:hypothetical protein
MQTFQARLQQRYNHDTGGTVSFPSPQFLEGNNTNLATAVANLMAGGYDAFAVAGSTGVNALVAAEVNAGLMPKIPIIQVVGGEPVPAGNFITGYHIDAATVAGEQVRKLHQKRPGINQLTVLRDPTSATATPALNAIRTVANQLRINVRQPVDAATPAALHALTLGPNPIAGMFMLCPSGMFYNDDPTLAVNPVQDIKTLVENANVPAIYPESAFKTKHRPGYPCWIYGHKIPDTYRKAADLANNALQNRLTPGSVEAPDKDDDTTAMGLLLSYLQGWYRRMINK